VVNRVGGWMDVVTAKIATIRRSACYPMMLCDALADFAFDAIRVEMDFEPF